MKNRTIAIFMFFLSFGMQAHQPDVSSTLLVEQNENKWVLQVRAALTAFEYEVKEHYGPNSYTTPEEFQELVLKHVQKNIFILYNGDNVAVLQNGKVKLGHETSVSFEVTKTPKNIQSLAVQNSSFSDIYRNQSALMILKKGFAKDQFVLNNENGHTVELNVNNYRFEVITRIQENEKYSFLIFGIALVLFFGIFFTFKNRKKMVMNRAT